MEKHTIVDKVSGVLFSFGIISARVPNSFFSGVAQIISLSLYLAAYLLWLAATHFYPQYSRSENTWYGLLEFRNQNKISAVIGTMAVVLSFLALFVYPVLIIPSVWLFVISNFVWSVSHYHKLQNPHWEQNACQETQQSFLKYTIATTILSIVTAVCISAAVLFPLEAPLLLTLSTGLGIALTVIAMGYLLHSRLIPCMKGKKSSYSTMQDGLSGEDGLKKSASPAPEAKASLDAEEALHASIKPRCRPRYKCVVYQAPEDHHERNADYNSRRLSFN